MNRRAVELARRQQLLLMRSGELRGELLRQADILRQPLALADHAYAGWRWLRTHPEAPLAAAAVLVLLRPQRAWRWGWRLWSGWRLYSRLHKRIQLLGLFRRS